MRKIQIFLALLFFTQSVFAQLQVNWQNCIVGPENDRVNDVIPLEDGYFILGSYGIHVSNPLIIQQYDVWLIKTDLYGNIVWDKKFGGSKDDIGKKILKTSDNNFIIVAQSSSNDNDLSNNPYPTSTNYWIYKINPSGDIIWSKIVGGNEADWPNNALITSDDDILIIGRSASNDGDVSTNYGSWDIWGVKLDYNGNIIVEFSFGTEGLENANDVIEDTDGGIIIGGTTAFYGNGNIYCDYYSELYGESLLIKLDSNLNLEWQQCYGGSLHESIDCITSFQNAFYVSHAVESNDGDLQNSGYHGALDIWLTELDSLGDLKWGKCFGGSKMEAGSRIFTELNGDVTLFGTTESNDGDVQGIHSPNDDIWVTKVDTAGNLKWQQCIGGNGRESVLLGVKKVNNNTYVVAVETFASFGTGDINCNTTADTGYDIWFFKVTDTTIVSRNENKFHSLKIFPNPADNYLIIQSEEYISGFITISNILGEKVIKEKYFERELYLDINNEPPGIYIYTITDNQGNYSAGKLIIN